jgi:hypothetical protein
MNPVIHPHDHAAEAIAQEFNRSADSLENSIRVLFGSGSPQLRDFLATAATYREEWQALASNRGLSQPALAFIGERGTGKTTLIRLLTGDDLQTAVPKPETSGRIRWIGPRRPDTLDPEFEEYRRLQGDQMIDLGHPYLLIDTPCLEPVAQENEALFHRLFTTTRFKIVVLELTKLESRFWQRKIAGYRGSVVLPVIRLDPEATRAYPGNLPALLQSWQRDHEPSIRSSLAGIQLETPVFLPHLDAMGGREISVPAVREALCAGLRRLLQSYQGSAADRFAELDASWMRFLTAMRPLVAAFDTPLLAERYRDLQQAIDKLPGRVLDHLLADERRTRALLRADLRSRLMDHVPAWAFPFRSLCGLLCLTNGLWDRLILGVAGSLPSAILTVTGAARNRSEEIQAEKSHRRQLIPGLRTLVKSALAMPWNGFVAALEKAGEQNSATATPGGEFMIDGDERLAELWRQAQIDATQREKGGCDYPVVWLSAAGAGVFWLFLGGPVVQTYGQYLPAAYRSLTGIWTSENLSSYPMPPWPFWLSAILLSLIPPFLLALLLVARRLGNRRLRACTGKLHDLMHGHLQQGTLTLDIQASDPRVQAYRELTSVAAGLNTQVPGPVQGSGDSSR